MQSRAPGSNVMRPDKRVEHHASTCRWGIPTVFLAAPCWWDSEDRPWACVHAGAPRPLETTEECAGCPHWEPHPERSNR